MLVHTPTQSNAGLSARPFSQTDATSLPQRGLSRIIVQLLVCLEEVVKHASEP
jgi:hypothetical protein